MTSFAQKQTHAVDAQPIQGAHPGESGTSALQYLLQGHATVPPELGVFLGTTWRMHPHICRFISDAVYDGRLKAHPDTGRQEVRCPADTVGDMRRVGAEPRSDRRAVPRLRA